MRTVEIYEEVLEAIFENIEYLHGLVNTVLQLLNAKKPDEWLTTKETAQILRISISTLLNLRVYGKIPFSQIDGRIMYLAGDVAKYLLKQKVAQPE